MRLIFGLFVGCALCFGQVTAVVVETPVFRFDASPADGSYQLSDKAAGVTWSSARERFGQISLIENGKAVRYPLAAFEAGGVRNARTLTFHPVPGRGDAWVRVSVNSGRDNHSLDLSYEAAPGLKIGDVRLLDEAFSISSTDKGYVVVPDREGILIPADSGVAFTRRFGTSDPEGCHMNMIGLVKSGAAMLVSWTDPYVAIEIKSATDTAGARGQTVATSAILTQSAKSMRLHLLGKGDYVAIAAAYRDVARANGLLVTWDTKIRQNPERAKYLGASNVKLWHALQRRMNEASTQELSVRVNWTFDEAAQVAEHVKNDLKMEKVLFGLGGWTKRGYDNQHPDILPAATEPGGDAAFADCARRVMKLGYLFSPHDNYQDMYHDSPSWSEDWIMKTADGSLVKGGVWAGGQAYRTCSRKAVELARRPQNLEAVKKLTGANSYFIDTTFAASLFDCFDPNHPLTKADDMHWKQAISDYARGVFGTFGSEDGREWAIPHADYFEGITGVSGTSFRNTLLSDTGGVAIPLFELVYHDAIAAYGKYSYDAARSAEYVLDHMILARPLNYHNVPNHLYWKGAPAPGLAAPPANGKDLALFVRSENGWAQGMHPADRFMKNTHEILSPLNEITGKMPMTRHEFLTADRKVQRSLFSDGKQTVEVVVNMGDAPFQWQSKLGGAIELPVYGFLVESPGFVAFRAQTWSGRHYSAAAIFTLRSLDGKPLAQSRRIKVFHASGDADLELRGTRSVVKEAVLELR